MHRVVGIVDRSVRAALAQFVWSSPDHPHGPAAGRQSVSSLPRVTVLTLLTVRRPGFLWQGDL
jgi:hypothetical protein